LHARGLVPETFCAADAHATNRLHKGYRHSCFNSDSMQIRPLADIVHFKCSHTLNIHNALYGAPRPSFRRFSKWMAHNTAELLPLEISSFLQCFRSSPKGCQ